MRLGLPEIALIGGIVLLIFGPARLRDLGSSLGKGVRGFKDETKNEDEEPWEDEEEE